MRVVQGGSLFPCSVRKLRFIPKYFVKILECFIENAPYSPYSCKIFLIIITISVCSRVAENPSSTLLDRIIHAFAILIIIITYRWSIPLLSLPQDNIQLRTCRTHLHGQGRLLQICSDDFQIENIPIFQTYSYVWKCPINENSTFIHFPGLCQRSFVRRVCLKVRGIPH